MQASDIRDILCLRNHHLQQRNDTRTRNPSCDSTPCTPYQVSSPTASAGPYFRTRSNLAWSKAYARPPSPYRPSPPWSANLLLDPNDGVCNLSAPANRILAAHATRVLAALAAADVTWLRILDVPRLHLEGGQTLDALKTILTRAAATLTHLSVTACTATKEVFAKVSLRKIILLQLCCARNEPSSLVSACLSQLSRWWGGNGGNETVYYPDVLEIELRECSPLITDDMDVPPCLSRIRHLELR